MDFLQNIQEHAVAGGILRWQLNVSVHCFGRPKQNTMTCKESWREFRAED